MRNDPANPVRTYLARLTRVAAGSDGELLGRYHRGGDEAAFAELVRRHGGAVAGVCRRWLGDPGRADDAAQATFLLLARRAGRLAARTSLAGWLHAAAVRVCRNARRGETRRLARERRAARPKRVEPADPEWAEALRRLDDELARLPERYRGPLVLCYLDGLTQAEVAGRLGLSAGAVRGLLDRGRARLRCRLERVGLPAAVLAAVPVAEALAGPARAALLATVAANRAGRAVPAAVAAVLPPTVASGWVVMGTTAATLVAVALATGFGDSPPAAVVPPAEAVRLGVPQFPIRPNALAHPAWLADGRTVLTATSTVAGWLEPAAGRVTRTWPLPAGHTLVGVGPGGATVCLTDAGGRVSVWDTATVTRVCELAVGGRRAATFTPDGSVVIGCDAAGVVTACDARTGTERWSVPGTPERTVLGCRPADAAVLVLTTGGSVQTLAAESGRSLGSFRLPAGATGHRLADAGRQVWAATRGEVRAWDATAGRWLKGHVMTQPAGATQPPRFAVSADGRTLAVVADGSLLVWDKPGPARSIPVGPTSDLEEIELTPDGRLALVARHGERSPRVFDTTTGQELARPAGRHHGPLVGAYLTPGGRVVSAGLDRTLRVWDAATGRELATHALTGTNTLAAVAPVGPDAVVTADHYPGALVVREVASGRPLRTLDPGCFVTTLQASADGTRVAVVGQASRQGVVVVLDAATGRTVARHGGVLAGSVALSADGRVVVAGGEDGVRLFAEGRDAPTHWAGPAARAVAVSADGGRVATATAEGVTVFTADGRGLCRIATGEPAAVALSPDGGTVAWAVGPVVQVAAADTGQAAVPLGRHIDTVRSLTFARDGTRLFSAAADATAVVWDVPRFTREN